MRKIYTFMDICWRTDMTRTYKYGFIGVNNSIHQHRLAVGKSGASLKYLLPSLSAILALGCFMTGLLWLTQRSQTDDALVTSMSVVRVPKLWLEICRRQRCGTAITIPSMIFSAFWLIMAITSVIMLSDKSTSWCTCENLERNWSNRYHSLITVLVLVDTNPAAFCQYDYFFNLKIT